MPKKKEPTYVQDSARDPEDAWIFDSLVGFLRGPVWHVPVMSFIEQKSLIFEPETSSTTDLFEASYKKVHEDYKQLVDFMLGSYMEDISITPQQFQKACGGALGNVKKQFNHNVFEQIWAADDFVVFKRMMIQKNIELQLQALELLQQKYGVLPDSLKPTGKVKSSIKREDSSSEEENDSEQKVMEEVKRKSLAEHQALKGEMDKEKREMEMAIARSVVDHQRLETEKKSQEDLMEQQMKKLSLTSPAPDCAAPSNKSSTSTSDDKGNSNQINPDELKKRTEFLKAQRDKLLAMKRAEREKQLEDVENGQNVRSRPKSAIAARSMMNGESLKIDPQTLKARKALAEKLKAEVIGH